MVVFFCFPPKYPIFCCVSLFICSFFYISVLPFFFVYCCIFVFLFLASRNVNFKLIISEMLSHKINTFCQIRTDVWGIGCLLYAWWYTYSPFECEFATNDHVRVVDCTYSRVLSNIPKPQNLSKNDKFILELVEWILIRNMADRPFCVDIIDRLERKENVSYVV